MKLSQWFEQTKKQKRAFAHDIGVTPQMISAYCKGDTWPNKKIMKAIARETGGAVTPNDWADLSEIVQ